MPTKKLERYYYTIYGLHLCADRPLPEVLPAPPPDAKSDAVRVFMVGHSDNLPEKPPTDGVQYYTSPNTGNEGSPILQVWRDQFYYHLVYHYGNQFLVSRTGDEVWCSWPAESDFELVIAYLLGPVLGFVLQLRGVLVLHASVVALKYQALAILGTRGAGKSTLAAELCRQGCQVLSDDIAAITWEGDQRVLVQPGYPRLRLWPNSAEALYGREHNLRLMVPSRIVGRSRDQIFDKRYLELDAGSLFLSTPQTLQAIYILDWSDTNPKNQINPLQGAQSLAMLDIQGYLFYLLDQDGRARQLTTLARLMKKMPVRQLHPTNNLTALPLLADVLLKDFEKLIQQ